MSSICVIFDLDGTLVDSEGLCNQAFLDLLPELDDTVDSLLNRYRGRKLASILADIEARLGKLLPRDFEKRYRSRVAECFDTQLKPIAGLQQMLERIPYTRCVASSGPRPKIRQALRVSGLSLFFGDHIFSSYDIGSWKPDPGLFLYAAHEMGFSPERCVVVEDSTVGIQAAAEAGMRALHFSSASDVRPAQHQTCFSDMAILPQRLDQLASAFVPQIP